jgi:hypothetical protein
MYIKPIGTNPPLAEDRIPLIKTISGDYLPITTVAKLSDGTPATDANSLLVFVLSQDRFDTSSLWTGTWNDGITSVNSQGLVRVTIAQSVLNTLRRGTYSFALRVSDKLGLKPITETWGWIQVEYEAASPCHDIPYKNVGVV